ncbi:MAG: hypothetical protein K2X81_13815, partial [Candidatus Obscuribacterales bacterium]|nr:hypothetical protein [Candidatus Obscuribacterales bacterium]
KPGSSPLDYMLAMVKHNFEKPNRQDLVKAEREFLESDVCKAEVKRQLSYNEQLQKHLASLASKPFEERVSGLQAASKILLKFEKPAEKGAGVPEVINAIHASALAETDKLFQTQVKALRGDLEALKPKVEAIEKQSGALSDAQQKILDRYYAGEDAIGEMVSERLVSRFGMKDKQFKMVDLGVDSGGFDVQRKGANLLTCLMDSEPKLNKDGVSEGFKTAHKTFLAALKEHGISAERLNGFVSIPMAKHSAADEVGCDCLLVNKHTGEYYAIDFTSNIEGPASAKLFSSKVLDSEFRLGPGKNVPADRLDTVIGAAGGQQEKAIRNAISNANPGMPAHKIDELVTQEEQKQLAEIIAKIISHKSKLNILETPLPSGLTDGTFSRMAYECRRFGSALENVGYSQWKASITGVSKFLQGQAIECSKMPQEIYNRSVVKLFPWASEWR